MSLYDLFVSTIIAIVLAITLPAIIAALSTIIGVVFPFVYGKYLKGYRTQIISVLTAIVGIMILISGKLLPGITETFPQISTEKITGIIITLLAFVQFVLRLFTDTAPGDMNLKKFSKRFTGSKTEIKEEIQKLRR